MKRKDKKAGREKITNDTNSSYSVDTDRQPGKQEERAESVLQDGIAYINVPHNNAFLAASKAMTLITLIFPYLSVL